MIKSNFEDGGLSPFMTVVSLVNGMIGGFILILPVFALETGYISTSIIILVTGFFSYFSC
jgi:amino acid permease